MQRDTVRLEAGLQKILANTFGAVYGIKDVKDQAYLQSKNIVWIFTPTVTTASSSRNSFFWPPTDFSVTIECIATDTAQQEVWRKTVTADGGVIAVREILKDHGLAAKTAVERSLNMLQEQLLATPEFRR